MPTISIIIATYNYGQYLPDALDSALAQTLQDFEIIIVDDGSTDNTDEVVQPFIHDSRIRYIRTAHIGQPGAKNTGIKHAQAPLIAFLDADDEWLPEKLKKQKNLFDTNPALGVVYSARSYMDSQGFALERKSMRLHRGRVLPQMFRNNFVCFSSCMVHRRVFSEVGLFDESIPMAIDYELWLRVAARFEFDFVDEPLVRYRTGHANLSQRTEERLHIALEIMDRFLQCQENRELLTAGHARKCLAETYCSLGLIAGVRSRVAGWHWFLRAIRKRPWHYAAWRGAASLALPEGLRRVIRRMLGRPSDWRTARQVSSSQDSQRALVSSHS